MNPKSGKAGNAVAPADPVAAENAAVADPGKAAQGKAGEAQKKSGNKSTAPEPKPHKPSEAAKNDPNKVWIEIELVDEDDEPVPGEAYEITLPDGTVAKGTLDDKGFARVDGIDPGNCKVTFPNIDKDAWDKA